MSKRYAMVNEQGKVINVIVWDGVRQFTPPQGITLVRHDECDVEDYWDCHKEELHKVCRINGCKDASHKTERVHTDKICCKHKD